MMSRTLGNVRPTCAANAANRPAAAAELPTARGFARSSTNRTLIPRACAKGSRRSISGWSRIVSGSAGSQRIVTRTSERPMSLICPKKRSGAAPFAWSSTTPICRSPAAGAARASAAQSALTTQRVRRFTRAGFGAEAGGPPPEPGSTLAAVPRTGGRMATRVGINGFGRIGRNFLRACLKREPDFEIVAINDLASPDVLAHMLKYDSTHGVLSADVTHGDGEITVDGASYRILSEREPSALPWEELGVEVVVESTGFFTARDAAAQHLEAGAKKVIISAPATEPDLTLVLGVNDDEYDPEQHHVISNASCTTNCVAPMARVLLDAFGIEQGFMTTAHAYTTEQQLQDQIALTRKGKPDLRRMRAAPQSIIPSTTGAAKATSLVIPELKGRIDGMAMRVPVPDGSVTDLVCVLSREVTAEAINDAFRSASGEEHWAGIMQYTDDAIVSADIVGNPHSLIVDGLSTMANGTMVKVIGWYDNEWGYSCRLVDVAEKVGASVGAPVSA